MEFNVDIRKKQLHSLKQYIRSSEDNVKGVFQNLGWTNSKTLQDEDPKIICPLNKNHLISQRTFKKHLEKCSLRTVGYEGNEAFLSEPPQNSDCSIRITNAKKAEIFGASRANKSEFKLAWNGRDSDPLTSDRFTSTFSVDERLALYEYSVKHTIALPKPQEFTLDLTDPKEKKELSEKEKLLLERDAKRRRAKYKSVHTSKKSQTEIMRELIDNQMTLYTDWLKAKQEKERKEKERLKSLSKEKIKRQAWTDQSQAYDNQYQYIGTTYDQAFVTQDMASWDQSATYAGTFAPYTIPTSEGVITDWSHLYQGGIDTEYDTSLDQHQAQGGKYVDSGSSLDPAKVAYANYSQMDNLDSGSGFLSSHEILEDRRGENRKVPSQLTDTSMERHRGEKVVKHEKRRSRNLRGKDKTEYKQCK